ncbi:MAG TPA: alpha/beta hydrolase [Ktedonobacteraceae bacterium]|nr:alpha/beta hydrolase [Ktedonobacteraceae bacterium]
MNPVHDEFIIAGDITLHYIQWGKQGPPIICVHGITANASCFQALAEILAVDHRVFAYDLRGRGDSDKPESGYSIPQHADDLAELIEELGLDRPVVVGHSLGGLIALHFATHYPQKLSKLVLIDAGTSLLWRTPAERPAWLTISLGRLGTPVASFGEYIQRLKAAPFLGPYWNEYMDLYYTHDVRRHRDGSVAAKCYREAALEDLLYEEQYEAEHEWANVGVPTLLLRAGQGLFSDKDQLLLEESAVALQHAIKNARYVNFPALNHYTIIFGIDGGPAREIRDFLDKD